MALFKSISELSDVVSHVVFCKDDNTFMLTLESTANEYWIPSSKVTPGNSWHSQSEKDLKDIFGETLISDKMLRVSKIWIPNHSTQCLYHCVYEVIVNPERKKKAKNTYGKYRGKIRWVTETELARLSYQENLKSPELVEYFMITKGNYKHVNTMLPENYENILPTEYIYHGVLVEINEYVIVPTGTNIYEQIVEAAAFNREVQITMYREFLLMCFPAVYMCLQVFSRLVLELGWPKEDIVFLFRSADIGSRGGLSFRDFIYFLAAIEPSTSHGGGPAELRCRYIFRFFDRDRDNLINFNEFKNLVLYLRKNKKQPLDAASVNRDAETSFKQMVHSSGNSLTIADFLHAVGDLKLRGTSQIYRSAVSIQHYIKELQERESKTPVMRLANNAVDNKTKGSTIGITQKKNARSITYDLAVHTVKLQKSGTAINVDEIWSMDAAVTFSSTNQLTINEKTKRDSFDQFNQKSVSNEVLKGLRYLTQINKTRPGVAKGGKRDLFSWGQLDSAQYARNFITVCGQTRDVLKEETRLLDLSSPVYVMGDLHGNFSDLLYFEKVLWHLGPGLCPSNLLFLGDYVDRGPYSMEVISYLFCYKLQSPSKVNLLRGNHEIRDIQKIFTFYTECCSKFGEKTGSDVWNAVNNAFDTMPIAATIDGKIFCCHGGIPPPWLCPVASAINTIPVPLSQPDEQSSLAWEIMWNDPVKQKQLTESMAMELMANEGFALNAKRGTAHVFSVDALERFLNTNGFSHIIRAHEVAQAGFNVQQRGKLLTVFSSSKYCGGQNEAACILADQGKLRILRLETS